MSNDASEGVVSVIAAMSGCLSVISNSEGFIRIVDGDRSIGANI
jgi:hypothetical protein